MSVPMSDVLHILRERGFVQQISDESALAALLHKGPVSYYCGFDPTASSLHVGSMIPLMALAHLARAGHRPIAVLGGGTAMVGDPSGKTELRQMLTVETIKNNRDQIEPQVRRFLGAAAERALVLDNAEWLVPLNYLEFLRDIGRHFSVNRMLAAEAYRLRLEKGLSFIEFNYQLLQAYDYLVLYRRYGCVLQVGGDDQWGNILAGTDLVRRLHQAETYALTFPLITTASGAKMGKTAAGAVWLSAERTSPFDFYQYFVNVDDRDVIRFLKLLTFLPLDEIQRFAALEGAELRAAKQALAAAVTEVVHGKEEADKAQQAAQAAFGGGGRPTHHLVAQDLVATPTVGTPTLTISTVPTLRVDHAALAAGAKIVDLLHTSGLAASKSAARRLVEQGGVKLGERKVTSVDDVVRPEEIAPEGTLLHAGKKHLRRIVVSD
jgi:tyrosyl-tRNA synthetase